MNRTIAAIVLVAVLAVGGGLIAVTAYQAGVGTAVTTAVAEGGNVVTTVPAWGYGYGYGWHPGGFGIFGLLFGLFFLFLILGLIRAIFWGGRRGWGPGGGPGAWGPGRGWWETRAHEGFDEWHRRAHDAGSSNEPPPSNTTSKPA
jgi:hypothetical protein